MSAADWRDVYDAMVAAEDEIDAAYWRFTRCARAAPPPRALYVTRNTCAARLASRQPEAIPCP